MYMVAVIVSARAMAPASFMEVCDSVGWNPLTSAGTFAEICAVLASLIFTAIVLLVRQPRPDTAHNTQALMLFTSSFFSLITTAVLFGAALGVLILSFLANGLGMLNLATEWQLVITGIIIIGAVAFDGLKRRRQ